MYFHIGIRKRLKSQWSHDSKAVIAIHFFSCPHPLLLAVSRTSRLVRGDIVPRFDLPEIKNAYAGMGSKAYPPSMMAGLLFYAYATVVFSSRKIERATYDSAAFRYVAVNTHPDHDTIDTFRRRFLKQLKAVFN